MALKKFYNIDFASARADLKTYLEANSDFKDYNFEGSALAQMLDVMAFGTQLQNFYLNMSMNELFMGSAQMTDNVYKLANMLNYMPKRKSAPYSTVDIQREQLMVNSLLWAGVVSPTETPPTGWSDIEIPGGFTYEKEDNHDGQEDCLKMTSGTGAADYMYQEITVEDGEIYELLYSFNRSGGNSNGQLLVGTTPGVGDLYDSSALTNDVWGNGSAGFIASGTTAYVTLKMSNPLTGESIYWDSIYLSKDATIIIPKYSEWNIDGEILLTNLVDITISDNEVQNVTLYEGEMITEEFDGTGFEFQTFELEEREDIDDQNLFVFNDEPDGAGGYINGITAWSNVHVDAFEVGTDGYFLGYTDTMKIKFDSGKLFNIPAEDDRVRVIYLKTNGDEYNGTLGTITLSDEGIADRALVICSNMVALKNGVDEESIEDIKLHAPLFYTTQNRAVTAKDHNILIKKNPIYSTWHSANLWGGEGEYIDADLNLVETSPTRDLGHVYVTTLKTDYDYLDDTEQDDLITWLTKYKFVAIFFRFLHPSLIQITPSVQISYSSVLNFDLAEVEASINTWMTANNGFEKTFNKSNLLAYVDGLQDIEYTDLSYMTSVKIYDELYKQVRFGAAVTAGSISGMVNGYAISDDGFGNIRWNAGNVGTINYATGYMKLNNNFGFTPGVNTYEMNFQYVDDLSITLERDSFLYHKPVALEVIS
jgi:hypothetical protein